ncbi:glucosamine-6-phosphate deaminase [Nesterenkonia marinintestina]|uniref:glucosamine-6-phosphate deaminase n=1 Tax=Nesterenkonia marinintestina TaxID=2979865 RepID=UPI0021C203DB|nr:glucosamine-6-phosphate deaminase [Nesterenkonia sp. GX14115]
MFSDPRDIAAAAVGRIGAALDAADAMPTLGVATGSSPRTVYELLRTKHQDGEAALTQVAAVALDEYRGLPADAPQRYRAVLREALVGPEHTGLRDVDLHVPDADAVDPVTAASRFEATIASLGGVDLQLLGLGENGHIGFNEPGTPFTERTHLVRLEDSTRHANSRFFDGDIERVPEYAMTQGLATILEAREIVLIAVGEEKATAVQAMVEGPVTTDCPASILQDHPQVTVLLDEDAASNLEMRSASSV